MSPKEYARTRGLSHSAILAEVREGALPTGVRAERINSDKRRRPKYRIVITQEVPRD